MELRNGMEEIIWSGEREEIVEAVKDMANGFEMMCSRSHHMGRIRLWENTK